MLEYIGAVLALFALDLGDVGRHTFRCESFGERIRDVCVRVETSKLQEVSDACRSGVLFNKQ